MRALLFALAGLAFAEFTAPENPESWITRRPTPRPKSLPRKAKAPTLKAKNNGRSVIVHPLPPKIACVATDCASCLAQQGCVWCGACYASQACIGMACASQASQCTANILSGQEPTCGNFYSCSACTSVAGCVWNVDTCMPEPAFCPASGCQTSPNQCPDCCPPTSEVCLTGPNDSLLPLIILGGGPIAFVCPVGQSCSNSRCSGISGETNCYAYTNCGNCLSNPKCSWDTKVSACKLKWQCYTTCPAPLPAMCLQQSQRCPVLRNILAG